MSLDLPSYIAGIATGILIAMLVRALRSANAIIDDEPDPLPAPATKSSFFDAPADPLSRKPSPPAPGQPLRKDLTPVQPFQRPPNPRTSKPAATSTARPRNKPGAKAS